MIYVYTCPTHKDLRQEVSHSMLEDPPVPCPECGERMRRVPQVPSSIHWDAQDTLMEWCDRNYRFFRARKRGQRAPRFSPDHVNRPDGGLVQNTRRYKNVRTD